MILVNEISVLQSYDGWIDALKRAHCNLLPFAILSTTLLKNRSKRGLVTAAFVKRIFISKEHSLSLPGD
jgi:hypothetical protein